MTSAEWKTAQDHLWNRHLRDELDWDDYCVLSRALGACPATDEIPG